MRLFTSALLVLCSLILVVGCGEDNPVRGTDELAPPTNLTMVNHEYSVDLTWDLSPFEPNSGFEGYNVYVDTLSLAGLTDTTSASTLEARRVNASPLQTRAFTVIGLANGASLQQGTKYYMHVRTVREDNRVSEGSNEVDTSPRPEDDNYYDGNANQHMYDFASQTTTSSAFGWNRVDGDGQPHLTAEANAAAIDFFMEEEPTSNDEGSLFTSPAQSNITSGWQIRNKTRFMDLGAGEAAWNTAVAPDTASMTQTVKVNDDHTYALYTHDGHWVKIRVDDFEKNVDVQGASLNKVVFTYAFQLINEYGRFKPAPGLTR